jgi:cell division protein ZapA (FtsZ GTPase activity inhibitor)
MPEAQSFKNHTRWDPPMHFFVLPLLLVNLAFAVTYCVRHWPDHAKLSLWWIVMSIVFIVLAVNSRVKTLKAQDRIIRLEEKLRMAALLPADEFARTKALTEAQFVALRFASDDELPALVKRTLDQNLDSKQIKESINSWRPDYFRV